MLTRTKQSDIDYLINNPNDYIVNALGGDDIGDSIDNFRKNNYHKAFTWTYNGKITAIIFRAIINGEYFVMMLCTKHLDNCVKVFFKTARYVLEKWQKKYIIKVISSTFAKEYKFHRLMGFELVGNKKGHLIWEKAIGY